MRDLRLKYVISCGETVEDEDESDFEIAIEDLFLTEAHAHEEFVWTEGSEREPFSG